MIDTNSTNITTAQSDISDISYSLYSIGEQYDIVFSRYSTEYNGLLSGFLYVNDISYGTNNPSVTSDASFIFYPPFYNFNNVKLSTFSGIIKGSSTLTTTIDLNKPIKFIDTPYGDTWSVLATSIGQSGNTYNATFESGSNINLRSKQNIGSFQDLSSSVVTRLEVIDSSFVQNISNLSGIYNVIDHTNYDFNFLMQGGTSGAVSGDLEINNVAYGVGSTTIKDVEHFFYPPFYDMNNNYLTTYSGIIKNSSPATTATIDLTKPIKIVDEPHADTLFAYATSTGQTGNTYNATFSGGGNLKYKVISDLSNIVVDLSTVVLDLSGDVATNTTNIATNTGNISTNTTAIATKLSKSGDTMTGDLALSGDIGIDFNSAGVPSTKTKKLYRNLDNGFENLYYNSKLIPYATINSSFTSLELPAIGTTRTSYFTTYKTSQNDNYLTSIHAPEGFEVKFNQDYLTGTNFRLSYSSGNSNYDMGGGTWATGSKINHGAISQAKYISHDWDDGTRVIDNNAVIINVGNSTASQNRDTVIINNQTNTSYTYGDLIVDQRSVVDSSTLEKRGGIRLLDNNNSNTSSNNIYSSYDSTNSYHRLNFSHAGYNNQQVYIPHRTNCSEIRFNSSGYDLHLGTHASNSNEYYLYGTHGQFSIGINGGSYVMRLTTSGWSGSSDKH